MVDGQHVAARGAGPAGVRGERVRAHDRSGGRRGLGVAAGGQAVQDAERVQQPLDGIACWREGFGRLLTPASRQPPHRRQGTHRVRQVVDDLAREREVIGAGGRDPVLGIERLQGAYFARDPDYDMT